MWACAVADVAVDEEVSGSRQCVEWDAEAVQVANATGLKHVVQGDVRDREYMAHYAKDWARIMGAELVYTDREGGPGLTNAARLQLVGSEEA